MKKLLFLALFFCLPAGATTYCVSNTGSDSNPGTATGINCTGTVSPWQTIAHVNAQTFSPGDTVLFQAGGYWGEILIPPSSGSAGSLISFGVYGAGAAPEISAADLQRGFIADQGGTTWTTIWSATAQTGSTWAGGGIASRNIRTALQAASVTGSATSIRVGLEQNSGSPYTLQGLYICAQSSASTCTATPAQLLQGGSGTITVAAGSGISYTDPLTFSVSSSTAYLVNMYYTGTTYEQIAGTGTQAYRIAGGGVDHSGDTTATGYNTTGIIWSVAQVQAGTARAPIANVYQVSLSYMPTTLWRDHTLGTNEPSVASLTANGQWAYDGGAQVLYIYSSDSPSNHVWQTNVRPNAVYCSAKSYLSLAGFILSGAATGAGGLVYSGLSVENNACANVTYTNNEIRDNDSSGMNTENGSSNIATIGGSLHDNGFGTTADNNCWEVGGIGSGSSNISISGAKLYNCKNADIEIASTNTDAIMAGVIVQNCALFNGSSYGIQIGGGHTGVKFLGNLIYSNAGYGLYVNSGTSGNPALVVYNNTIWGNGTGGVNAANVSLNANGTVFENNIVGAATGSQELTTTATETSITLNYNDWYHAAGGSYMSWNGAALGFASYQSSSSQDANSIASDPSLTNVGSNIYTLTEASPARQIGTPVGLQYPYRQPDLGSVPYYAQSANTAAF